MTIVNKIKQLCESVTGLPFLYDSMGKLNVLLDNADYPCVYCTLLETTSVTNENGNIVEGVRVALVVCNKTEFDVGSIENENIIASCKNVANNILRNIRLTGTLVLDSINEAQRFYEQYDVILTGYALNLTVSEIYGDTGCDIEPITITITENGEYDVTGVQKAIVSVEISEKEQLLNYFRKGGNSLYCFHATENYDLDLSDYNILLCDTASLPVFAAGVTINGKLTLDGNKLFNPGRMQFQNWHVESFICPHVPISQAMFYGATIEELLYVPFYRSGHTIYNPFSVMPAKKCDVHGGYYIYNAQGGAIRIANWPRCEWADLTGINFSPITAATWQIITGAQKPLLRTLIGDREDETYDINVTVLDNYPASFSLVLVPNLGWKTLMAIANGVATVAELRTITLSTTHQTTLQNAEMLETFEQTLTDKGWTIIYQ